MRVPHLPVVVECGGFKRRWLVQKRARHAEQRRHLKRLAREFALVGDAHVGEELSAQVKACELDAVIVAGNRFEDIRRDRRLRICFGVRADWWDSLAPTSEGLCRGV